MNLNERIVERYKQALVQPKLQMGKTLENGMVRVHRYADYFKVWDLTNAGKRGKQVNVANISPAFTRNDSPDIREERWRALSIGIESYDTFQGILGFFRDLNIDFPDAYEIRIYGERSVDVMPAGFEPIEIKTDKLSLKVEYKDFMVVNEDDQDNLPTCIPAVKGGLKGIPIFYRWVKDNADSIKHMSYHDVVDMMNKLGVPHHSYCAID